MKTPSTEEMLRRKAERLRDQAKGLREEAERLEQEAEEIEAELDSEAPVSVEIRCKAESILLNVRSCISLGAIEMCERAMANAGDERLQRDIAALWQNFGCPDFTLPPEPVEIDPKDFIFPPARP